MSPKTAPDVAFRVLNEKQRAIVQQHLPQVELIARRIHRTLPVRACLEDLVHSGIIGLIGAVLMFKPSRGAKLETYAEYKIRGAIFDGLRAIDWGPRRLRQRSKQIEAAIERVQHKVRRSPTEEELAEELGLSVKKLRMWMMKIQGLNLLNLSAPGDSDGKPNGQGRDFSYFLSIPEEAFPDVSFFRGEYEQVLRNAIACLPISEKEVITLYYYKEMTLSEISKIILRHESRVSQLKGQAITRLRGAVFRAGYSNRGGLTGG